MRSKLLFGGVAAGAALLIGTPLVAQAAASITSADIVNSTIRSKDVKNGGLKGKDLANNTVTGANVDENSLAKVPDADKLDGLDSAVLKTRSYRFRLPTEAAASTNDYTFPVPAGHYLATYAVVASMTTAGENVSCAFAIAPGTATEGRTYGSDFASFSTASGSAILTVGASAPRLECFGGSNFVVNPDSSTVSSVTFTVVDTLTEGTGTAVRAGRSSKGSAG